MIGKQCSSSLSIHCHVRCSHRRRRRRHCNTRVLIMPVIIQRTEFSSIWPTMINVDCGLEKWHDVQCSLALTLTSCRAVRMFMFSADDCLQTPTNLAARESQEEPIKNSNERSRNEIDVLAGRQKSSEARCC